MFVIILNTSGYITGKPLVYVSDLSNFGFYNPIYSIVVSIILLSMAGIPPLAGFFSKYLVLLNAIDNSFIVLGFVGVIISCISTFYYLRIIKLIFFKQTEYFYYKHLNDIVYPLQSSITFNSSIILGVTS
jgi:NADH:ubiquinone oxidoreductase subunit 2 (subunit N)